MKASMVVPKIDVFTIETLKIYQLVGLQLTFHQKQAFDALLQV